MPACTFFGHRECPQSVIPKLRTVLTDLIVHHDVNTFYVGNQGCFDAYVKAELRRLAIIYPQIQYAVVLAYIPREKICDEDDCDTMLPEGIESVHPRYAISWRNNWMLDQSDFVVSYITHQWGGAAQYIKKAKKQNKILIELS